METAVKLIQILGFPIFVCLWLMYRQDKRLDAMHKSHNRTNVILAVLVKVLTEGNGAAVPSDIVDEASGLDKPLEESET